MITKVLPFWVVVQGTLCFRAVNSLGQSAVNTSPEHCEGNGDSYGSLERLSLMQKTIAKTNSAAGQSVLQDTQLAKANSATTNALLQKTAVVSKTNYVWDEDDGGALLDDGPVDPIESILETLNVPVTTDVDPWSTAKFTAPPLHGGHFNLSPAESAARVITNASLNSELLATAEQSTPGPTAPKLTKEATVLLLDLELRPTAELTSQPPEVVDPQSSMLQEVPLKHYDRVPSSQMVRPKILYWRLPMSTIFMIACVVTLVVVMICAACSGSLRMEEVESKSPQDGAYYDENLQHWIPVEVVGKVHSGAILVRFPQDGGKLLLVDPESGNLRNVDSLSAAKSQFAMEPATAISFPQHVPYDPSRRSIAEELHWRWKQTHERLIGAAEHKKKKKKPQKKHHQDHSDGSHHKQKEIVDSPLEEVEEIVENILGVELEHNFEEAEEELEDEVGALLQGAEVLEAKASYKKKKFVKRLKKSMTQAFSDARKFFHRHGDHKSRKKSGETQ